MKRKRAKAPSRQLRGRALEAYIIWEDRLEAISEGWCKRPEKGGDPDNRKTAFLMREIYWLVDELKEEYGDKFEDALLAILIRAPEIPFHKAPYFWALKAANGAEDIRLTDDMVLRYGLALNYAHKHNVPPHLLCGFLHQVGGIRSIDRKSREGYTEYWLQAVLSNSGDEDGDYLDDGGSDD